MAPLVGPPAAEPVKPAAWAVMRNPVSTVKVSPSVPTADLMPSPLMKYRRQPPDGLATILGMPDPSGRREPASATKLAPSGVREMALTMPRPCTFRRTRPSGSSAAVASATG